VGRQKHTTSSARLYNGVNYRVENKAWPKPSYFSFSMEPDEITCPAVLSLLHCNVITCDTLEFDYKFAQRCRTYLSYVETCKAFLVELESSHPYRDDDVRTYICAMHVCPRFFTWNWYIWWQLYFFYWLRAWSILRTTIISLQYFARSDRRSFVRMSQSWCLDSNSLKRL